MFVAVERRVALAAEHALGQHQRHLLVRLHDVVVGAVLHRRTSLGLRFGDEMFFSAERDSIRHGGVMTYLVVF